MAITINTALRSVLADALSNDMNSGLLRVYDGVAPADADAALGAQTLLAEVTLPADAFVENGDGTVSLNGTWEDNNINASGTATWFRLVDATVARIMQGTVAVGSGDLQVDDDNFVAGGVFSITTFVVTMPGA